MLTDFSNDSGNHSIRNTNKREDDEVGDHIESEQSLSDGSIKTGSCDCSLVS